MENLSVEVLVIRDDPVALWKNRPSYVRSGLRWETFLKLVGDFSVIFEGAW